MFPRLHTEETMLTRFCRTQSRRLYFLKSSMRKHLFSNVSWFIDGLPHGKEVVCTPKKHSGEQYNVSLFARGLLIKTDIH